MKQMAEEWSEENMTENQTGFLDGMDYVIKDILPEAVDSFYEEHLDGTVPIINCLIREIVGEFSVYITKYVREKYAEASITFGETNSMGGQRA